MLVATHSTEILRHARPQRILQVRSGGKGGTYLTEDHQKVGLMAGLGSDYAPRVDRLRKTKRLLMMEGRSDERILQTLAGRLGVEWPEEWIVWRTTDGQRDRRRLFRALRDEIPELIAYSLRDRDDKPVNTIGPDLEDKDAVDGEGFHSRVWRRRHIESYLIWPPAIARATRMSEDQIEEKLRENHNIAVSRSKWADTNAPQAALDINGKGILKDGDEAILGQLDVNAYDVAAAFEADEVPEDIGKVLAQLRSLV